MSVFADYRNSEIRKVTLHRHPHLIVVSLSGIFTKYSRWFHQREGVRLHYEQSGRGSCGIQHWQTCVPF